MLYVVATGRHVGDITLDGVEILQSANIVVIKSQQTHMAQLMDKLKISNYISCDSLYDSADNFDALNNSILDQLTLLTQKYDKVAFCVLGQGTDDSTVELIAKKGMPFQFVAGVSTEADALSHACGGAVISYTATQLLLDGVQHISGNMPLVVKYIDDNFVAGELKLLLTEIYDYDTPMYVYNGQKVVLTQLEQLDRQKVNYQTAIVIQPKPLCQRQLHTYSDIGIVIQRLRAPDGCPWDKEQTHMSLRKNVVEEAYELVSAIESDDIEHIVEELGDILMQFALHTAIAVEDNEFVPSEVYSRLCNKLITRHPHVFGDLPRSATAQEALTNWEAVKKKEHKIKDLTHNLLDVPQGMSQLMRAQKLQYRAHKGGYDFENVEQAVDKLNEELGEVLQSHKQGNAQELEKEGGDLLFATVNVLRLLGVDCEIALGIASQKFVNRVIECEKILYKQGKQLTELTAEQFDQLWQEVKRNEQSQN